MSIKDELLFDFSMNMPRLLVSGKTGILDNVKKILLISDKSIIVDHGNKYSAINGEDLVVKQLEEERMLVTGSIRSVEFYGDKKGDDQ
ncbi:YabP/YqfC family sporulation protein [Sinanaerobacter chloroacetimidivorans]|uniref:YabP/YqfC family sporulation protein n=1 Tax=Sinanaerobacter chloroacetimidivorans TaxID=2818044 RepID=A0A8J7VX37_9FIRM|nr:YabP/YqfC family sporulation protein [Sinanaerobacter chloroacetimidivorans]MBR0596344.1 YabP/YqfC family sporulation protein [Sinanaerobacter chloroacetimidivorans]